MLELGDIEADAPRVHVKEVEGEGHRRHASVTSTSYICDTDVMHL